MGPIAVTGAVVMAVGVLVTLLFGPDRRRVARLVRGGREVIARVVGSVERDGEEDPIYGGGGGFAPLVSFRTAEGDTVTAASSMVLGSRRRVPPAGSTVRVHYDPGDPRRIFIHGWDSPVRYMSSGYLAGGALMLLVGASMVVMALITG